MFADDEGGNSGGGGAEGNQQQSAAAGGADAGSDAGADDDGPEFEFEEPADDKGAGGAGAGAPVKGNFSRFKEIDEEADDEDKVYDKFKKLKDENQNLSVLAKGRKLVEENKEIQTYQSLLRNNDEDLAFMALVQDAVDGGKGKEEARLKAKEKIEKIKAKEDGADQIESIASNARKLLRGVIADKEGEILESIKTAEKSVSLLPKDDKVVETSKSEVAKLDRFLGFKFAEGQKEKVTKSVQSFIGSEAERKAFADPATRAKIAMYLVHEKQWEKNVTMRKSGKIEAVKAAQAQPKVTKSKIAAAAGRNQGQGSGRIMNSPASFLGKAVKGK